MPREAGRPREIDLPRRGSPAAAAPDSTTIEKPTRAPRPVVAAREQVEEDDRVKRGPGGVKIPRPAVKVQDDGPPASES